ncbi:MAG: fibronectin type III domain-containing protein [Chloroflexi bacterium]|nr:fibronectin type III domain-containing protein [Chloroflexota bacterium]
MTLRKLLITLCIICITVALTLTSLIACGDITATTPAQTSAVPTPVGKSSTPTGTATDIPVKTMIPTNTPNNTAVPINSPVEVTVRNTATPIPATATAVPVIPTISPTPSNSPESATITVLGEISRTILAGKALTSTLQVIVKDAAGKPLKGVMVTFSAPAPPPNSKTLLKEMATGTFEGTYSVIKVTTDEAGIATGTTFTATKVTGVYQITVSVEGIAAPVIFELTSIDVPNSLNDLEAIPGDGQVTLNWEPPVNTRGRPVIGYIVYQLDAAYNKTRLTPTMLGPDVRTYVIKDLANDKPYMFAVSAVNIVGEGVTTYVLPVTPRTSLPIPEAPTITQVFWRDKELRIFWVGHNSEGKPEITGFKLYRQLYSLQHPLDNPASPWQLIATLPATQDSYFDADVTAGVTYSYYITAINSAGEGYPSNVLFEEAGSK